MCIRLLLIGIGSLLVLSLVFRLQQWRPIDPGPEVVLVTLLEAVLNPSWVWMALGEIPNPGSGRGGHRPNFDSWWGG
jgi:hypothetical protein